METTQQQVFEGAGVPRMIQSVVDGYNATLFAYGARRHASAASPSPRPASKQHWLSGEDRKTGTWRRARAERAGVARRRRCIARASEQCAGRAMRMSMKMEDMSRPSVI